MSDWGVSVHAPETVRAPDEETALKRAAKQTTFTVSEIVEPPPPPPPPVDPVPKGVFVKGDDMTLPTAEAIERIWAQHSGVVPPKIEWRTDGPVIDGVQYRCRRIIADNEDRPAGQSGDLDAERNEIGRVNGTEGFVFAVGKRYVTRTWHRLPDVDWDGERGNCMQMKMSGRVAAGGFGGDGDDGIPPLSLLQNADGIQLKSKPTRADAEIIWEQGIDYMRWFELAYDITYAFDGHIDLYFRYEGQTPQKVLSWDGSPIKRNRDGKPMHSTYRVGIYQDKNAPARFNDVSRVNQDLIK